MGDPLFLALTRTPSSASCPAVTLPVSASEPVCAGRLPVPARHAVNTRKLTLVTFERRGMTTSLDFAYCYFSGTAFGSWYLDLYHVEVALGRAAVRANPVVWNVGPPGARRQALIRCAGLFVVDVAASPALPGFIRIVSHMDSRSCVDCGREALRV